MPRRKERSKTPEVHWETLPEAPPPVQAASQAKKSRTIEEKPRATEEKEELAKSAPSEGLEAENNRKLERDAWRSLVLWLAALQGDVKVHSLLTKEHPELVNIGKLCGAGAKKVMNMAEAKESAKAWFERGLKGSNHHGPTARAALCDRLAATLRSHSASLRAAGVEHASQVLERGRLEIEGPLICSLMRHELEGSSYSGLWISREGPGTYCLGDQDDTAGDLSGNIRVAVKVFKGELQIDGYFDDEGALQNAKSPIGVFLTIYFEGGTVKVARERWKAIKARGSGGSASTPARTFGNGITVAAASSSSDSAKAASLPKIAPLPPGWELRESRSKKGVYYYANEAKGLSQIERPKA